MTAGAPPGVVVPPAGWEFVQTGPDLFGWRPVAADAVAGAVGKPDVMPYPGVFCDWGDCEVEATHLRWAADLGAYLPVCTEHAGSPS